MAGHYTYLDHVIPQVSEAAISGQKFALSVVVGCGLLLLGKILTSRLKTADGLQASVIPSRKPSLFSFCDLLMEGFIKYHDSVLGNDQRHHVPFTASVFFFILVLNLLGLIPGMPAATTTVWLNVGIALVVFVHFNYYGIKTNGLMGYLKHFWGPIALLGPFLFCLEILSTCMRVLTLNLRLYWNISADHVVLATFTDIFSNFPLPLSLGAAVFYFLGIFVSFIQAFVFATLTMIYILLAVQHEEDH